MRNKWCIVVVSIGLCVVGVYVGVKGGYYLGYGRGFIDGLLQFLQDKREEVERRLEEGRKQMEDLGKSSGMDVE